MLTMGWLLADRGDDVGKNEREMSLNGRAVSDSVRTSQAQQASNRLALARTPRIAGPATT